MGVLGASKPWPMSAPPNPTDFPGYNPIPVQATLITNYFHQESAGQNGHHHNNMDTSSHNNGGVVRRNSPRHFPGSGNGYIIGGGGSNQNEYVSSPCRSHHQQQQQQNRKSVHVSAINPPPLYEIVRPKSACYMEDELYLKGKSYQSPSTLHHYRQKSDIARPPLPPPLPPSRPSSAVGGLVSRNDPNFLARPPTTCVPWLKKIKVIKKLKRRIGQIGSAKAGTSFNNLPPLRYHNIHGENVQIFQHGTLARRINSFCKAIVFSDRAVKINEKVCLRLSEISTNWSGVLRFGFTYQDPLSLRNSLPKYVCPDLTSRPGFWAKAFSEHLVKHDAIINFHVNTAGEVHFSIDGEDKGVFLSGIDTRAPLWAVIDIYGNTTAVELVDTRAHLNNSRPSLTDGGNSPAVSSESSFQRQHTPTSSPALATKHVQQQSPVKTFAPAPSSSSGCGGRNGSSSRTEYFEMSSLSRCLPSPAVQHHKLRQPTTSCSAIAAPTVPPPYKSLPLSKSSSCFQQSAPKMNIPADHRGHAHQGPSTSKAYTGGSSPASGSPSRNPPTTPKIIRASDDYESIYSVKSAIKTPAGSGNYSSVSSLSKVHVEYGATSTCTPSKPSPKSVADESPSKDLSGITLECLACCERPVDSVFYSCGHMCMCYTCALGYWRTKEKGHCPICRAPINDVIRTYM